MWFPIHYNDSILLDRQTGRSPDRYFSSTSSVMLHIVEMVTDMWAWRFQNVQIKGYSVAFNKGAGRERGRKIKEKTSYSMPRQSLLLRPWPVGQFQRKKWWDTNSQGEWVILRKSEGRSKMLLELPLHSALRVLPWAEGKSVLKEVGKCGMGRSWFMACTFQHRMIRLNHAYHMHPLDWPSSLVLALQLLKNVKGTSKARR